MKKYKWKALALVSLLAMLFAGLAGSPVYASVPAQDLAGPTSAADQGAVITMKTPPGKITFDPAQVAAVQKAAREGARPGQFGKDGKTKLRPPSPFTGAGYYHTGVVQGFSGTDYVRGTSGTLGVYNPYVDTGNCGGSCGYSHSLAEMAVRDTGSNSNVVEFGWAVEKNAFGDTKTRLFASTWNAGVWNGCYDAHTPSCWFIDNTSATPNLGDDLTSVVNATYPSNSVPLQIFWSATTCGPAASGWWLVYNSVTIGCFYSAAFTGSFSTVKYIQTYGEYYYDGTNNSGTSNDKPFGDVGKGIAASSAAITSTGPAWIGSLGLINPSPSTLTPSFATQAPEDSSAYSVSMVGTSVRTFTYGGAGYKMSGGVAVTPGNVGP